MHTGAATGAHVLHIGAGAGQVLHPALLIDGAQIAAKRAKVVNAFIFFLLYRLLKLCCVVVLLIIGLL